MNSDILCTMANQIGEFFSAFDDEDEAFDGLATHLQRYWTPDMRRTLLAQLDAQTSAGTPRAGASSGHTAPAGMSSGHTASADALADGLDPFVVRALIARRDVVLHPDTAPPPTGPGLVPDAHSE